LNTKLYLFFLFFLLSKWLARNDDVFENMAIKNFFSGEYKLYRLASLLIDYFSERPFVAFVSSLTEE
jgi:hypothetical protein